MKNMNPIFKGNGVTFSSIDFSSSIIASVLGEGRGGRLTHTSLLSPSFLHHTPSLPSPQPLPDSRKMHLTSLPVKYTLASATRLVMDIHFHRTIRWHLFSIHSQHCPTPHTHIHTYTQHTHTHTHTHTHSHPSQEMQ